MSWLELRLTIDRPPVPLAYSVYLVLGDGDHWLGNLYAPAGHISAPIIEGSIGMPISPPFTLLLVPSRAIAAGQIDGVEYASQPLLLEGIVPASRASAQSPAGLTITATTRAARRVRAPSSRPVS